MNVRSIGIALVAALVLGGAIYALLRPRDPGPEEPAPPAPAAGQPPRAYPVGVLVGTLVVRVKTSDGKPLPADALAGYRNGREPRMRKPSAEGTVRFSDVPLGAASQTRLEAVAEATGYFPASKEVLLARDLPNEAVLTLTAAP